MSQVGLTMEESFVSLDLHAGAVDSASHESQLEGCKMAMEDGSLGRGYSIVISRKSWCEVVCAQDFDSHFLQVSPGLQVETGVSVCAFQSRPGLTRWVPHVFAGEQDVLCLVNHNPVLDVNFC